MPPPHGFGMLANTSRRVNRRPPEKNTTIVPGRKHNQQPGTSYRDAIPRVIIYFRVIIIVVTDVSSTILHNHRLLAKGYDYTFKTRIMYETGRRL